MALNDYSSGLLEKIHQADSWQAAAWILERRFPEEFGRRAADADRWIPKQETADGNRDDGANTVRDWKTRG